MGSVVEYRCRSCAFSTGRLSLGWGKAGRARYWGALAHCENCKTLVVVDLSDTRLDQRDRRCEKCRAVLKLLEGMAHDVSCPQCRGVLTQSTLGTWA
jgi:predicted Zn finger-like uncharacterized protein